MIELNRLVRENIRRLAPYSSARHEFAGSAEIFLDANENAFGSPIEPKRNRYPDPLQTAVKESVAKIKGVSPSQIFIGNGSDEAIDLLFRIFCEPGRDSCIICPPTYGMYQVAADINDVKAVEVQLTAEYQLDVAAIKSAFTERTKLLFICSPNNPTGNAMRRSDILDLASSFDGIVVVDEAYIDFSSEPSLISDLADYPNLVVLQTFSKAWGMAGARVGLALASEEIIDLLNRVKPPYNVSQLSQTAVIKALSRRDQVAAWIRETLSQRRSLQGSLEEFDFVDRIYPSDANFLLVKVNDANAVYRHLVRSKIVVRNRTNVALCEGCLRITIGTAEENVRLIRALELFRPSTNADGRSTSNLAVS